MNDYSYEHLKYLRKIKRRNVLILISSLLYCCQIKVQNLYRSCCFHNLAKKISATYEFNLDENEIKQNKDGTKFIVNKDKISELLSRLAILSLDYPDDLNDCAFYLFAIPPPAAYNPIEQRLMAFNKINIVFVYGKDDWMDKTGAYRLNKYDQDKYKIFSTSYGGHSFALENPKELSLIISQYFES